MLKRKAQRFSLILSASHVPHRPRFAPTHLPDGTSGHRTIPTAWPSTALPAIGSEPGVTPGKPSTWPRCTHRSPNRALPQASGERQATHVFLGRGNPCRALLRVLPRQGNPEERRPQAELQQSLSQNRKRQHRTEATCTARDDAAKEIGY